MCLETLDRELATICSEIEEDQALMTTQLLQDTQFQLGMADKSFSSVVSHMSSLESLEPVQKGKASSSSIGMVHHVRDLLHTGTAASYTIKQVAKKTSPSRFLVAKTIQTPERAVPKYDYYVEIERSILVNNPKVRHAYEKL
jgi:hypothetical protein